MRIFTRILIFCMLFAILVGCNTSPSIDYPTITPAQATLSVTATKEAQRLPTATRRPSVTPSPRPTIDLTQTVVYQDALTAQSIEQTLVAQFPHVCETSYSPREFSPNGIWLAELCDSEDNQDMILTLSKKDTQVLWKLVYKDYIPQTDFEPDGALSVVHWSKDERYVYFFSYLGGDGGECFVGFLDSGSGLFRLDLQTGNVSIILPLKDNIGFYTFAFSPTGRRLLYGANSRDLKVLDIQTGQLINIVPANDFSQGGGYLWSSDGLEFLYTTVLWNNMYERVAYSLRLVDAQTGSERILLESPDNCFATKSWSDNNVLTIERYDNNYDQTLVEYDLNLNKIVSEATATP